MRFTNGITGVYEGLVVDGMFLWHFARGLSEKGLYGGY